MEKQEWNKDEMDRVAQAAGDELTDMGPWDKVLMPQVADWWRRWVGRAGHKRLGRIIMGVK